MTYSELLGRRTFLAGAARVAAAGWLSLEVQLLAGCARDNSARDKSDASITHLTPAEARTMRAFAAQILPSDDGTPGAEELGAVYFVDRAFDMPFFADSVPIMRHGLADLDARATAASGHRDFASATSAQQIAIMRQVEATPFFATARTLVVIGALADPSYGGNRGRAGWSLLGIDHRPSYTAPYGWYDARLTSAATKTGA